MISIIDYGVCNVGSILNMLKRVGASARLVASPAELAGSSKLILPGIGAFDAGMGYLRQKGFVEPLREMVLEQKTPILGICLGAQLMTMGSEEGNDAGLGFFPAHVRRFRFETPGMKVPHIGWNRVKREKPNVLLDGYAGAPRFYFVHSYYMACDNPSDVIATTTYGQSFCSIIGHGGTVGVQFHPEKSHKFGMQLMRNFAALTREAG